MKLPVLFRKSPTEGGASNVTASETQRALNAAEAAEEAAEQLLRVTPVQTPRGIHARRRVEAAVMQRQAAHFIHAATLVRDAAPRARKIAQQAHTTAQVRRDAAWKQCEQLAERAKGLDQRLAELQLAQVHQLAAHRQAIEEARARLDSAVDGDDAAAEIAAAQAVQELLRHPPDAPDSALAVQIGAVNARRGTLSQEIAAADQQAIEAEAALARAVADLYGIARDLANLAAMEAALQYAVISGQAFYANGAQGADVYCIGQSSILFNEAGPLARFLAAKHESTGLQQLANSMRPAWADVLAVDPDTLSDQAEPEPQPLPPGVYSSVAAEQHFSARND